MNTGRSTMDERRSTMANGRQKGRREEGEKGRHHSPLTTHHSPGTVYRLSSIVFTIIALGAIASACAADTFNYTTGRRQIKVGIVVTHALDVFDNAKNLGSENPDPHVFYVMESRTDLKP